LSSFVTGALNRLYGAGQASFATYPAYTLYGLAHGGNYKTAERDLATEIETLPSERAVARLLYERAWARIKNDPLTIVATLGWNGRKFLDKIPTNFGAIVNPRALIVPSVVRARPAESERRYNRWLGLPLVILVFLAALLRLMRRSRPSEAAFWVAMALGFFLSTPLVFGDAGFRGLAAAYPLLAVGLSLGLTMHPMRIPISPQTRDREQWLAAGAAALTCAILLAALIGPAVARRGWPRPARQTLARCLADEVMLASRETSSAVLVAHVRRPDLDVPTLEQGEFLRQLDLADLARGDDQVLRGRRLPFALLSVYDFVSRSQRTVIAPVAVLRVPGGWLQIRARPVAGSLFFETTSFERVSGEIAP
jgi:hypothetical protein